MKRYSDYNGLNDSLVDDPNGPWVQYEPWMEEAEKMHQFFNQPKTATQAMIEQKAQERAEYIKSLLNICQADFNSLKEAFGLLRLEAKEELKQPTICVECKFSDGQLSPEWLNICHSGKDIDFVSGKPLLMVHCCNKNHGNCPDFKAKE